MFFTPLEHKMFEMEEMRSQRFGNMSGMPRRTLVVLTGSQEQVLLRSLHSRGMLTSLTRKAQAHDMLATTLHVRTTKVHMCMQRRAKDMPEQDRDKLGLHVLSTTIRHTISVERLFY